MTRTEGTLGSTSLKVQGDGGILTWVAAAVILAAGIVAAVVIARKKA